ncbi:hypothetical protein D8798_08175 [Streptococcus cristatus]|uniref:Uncharacterized protein n=1 Tax=Streptococcus cristatus TaxID=45634 RepID=A0A3R9L6M1_STRCR|nr:hypothetical protein D8798_08175 [Streptococcus cristatus]
MNETYKVQVQDLVDDLKAVFTHAGLGGEAGEYKLLTQSFLYKFLNDKFLYQAKILDESNTYENLLAMSEEDYDWLLEDIGTSTAWLKPDQLIETLHRQQNESTFYETFEIPSTKSPLIITISSPFTQTGIRPFVSLMSV